MKKPKTASPKPKTEPDHLPATQPLSLAASFARFLPLAQKLPAERVLPCRLDVNLIFANAKTGAVAVLAHLDRIKSELPMLHVERFVEHEELAGSLLYASAQTEVSAAPIRREQMLKQLSRLQELREPMLLIAEGLALMGLIPKQRVDQIRRGKGAFDAAQDGVALADLYTEFEPVIANKHPFTTAHLTEIAELGHSLMRVVTPDGARTPQSLALATATEARDRIYTLLFERHTDLRRAGAYLFGEEVDEKVPLLGARKGRSRSESAPSTPSSAPPSPDSTAAQS